MVSFSLRWKLLFLLMVSAPSVFGQRRADPAHPIPVEKGLPSAWTASLTERGVPTVLRGWESLRFVGMPVGGIGCGTVYLGGDGRLWCWDIFHQRHEGVVPNQLKGGEFTDPFGGVVRERDGASFVRPVEQQSPWNVDLGFSLHISGATPRPLDRRGFRDITFEWRYPMSLVRYADPEVPVVVELEAFSPFIPLDVERSSYPATVLKWRLLGKGPDSIDAEVVANVVNPVLRCAPPTAARRRIDRPWSTGSGGAGAVGILCGTTTPSESETRRADLVVDTFERGGWGTWIAEGAAFDGGPLPWARRANYHDVRGHEGDTFVTSHNPRIGGDCGAVDALVGTLTSAPILLERDFLVMRVAGGRRPTDAFVEVFVDGRRIASVTGHDGNDLRPIAVDVRAYRGSRAVVKVVDAAKGPWGHITVDDIVQSDRTPDTTTVEQRGDFGTFAVAAIGSDVSATSSTVDGTASSVRVRRAISKGNAADAVFVVAWHFPNVAEEVGPIPGLASSDRRPKYAVRFVDAGDVLANLVAELPTLERLTRLWTETWYGGTLPRWFLERTLVSVCNLQTTTFSRFANGQVWAWEGVGACEGTCTHVWHYAQAMARLFPELERDLRERTDYGIAFRADGMIDHRGGLAGHDAIDGQAGVILRTLREHQTGSDGGFLGRVWTKCRKATEYLIACDARDGAPDGLIAGEQANTLDAAWFGAIPSISSMYLAALSAAASMAEDVGDHDFSRRCRAILERGRTSFAGLFDHDRGYFVQREDPSHLDAIGVGVGCHIDQVLGAGWAQQVGLPVIIDPTLTDAALRSLWTHNFAPDMGVVRASSANPRLRGRPYALDGHRGLVMCTWPYGERRSDWERHWQFGYFQEAMTGFEHFAAATMVGTGTPELVRNGLSVVRGIHDRYDARERNPFNEIECSDHYARAMASYAVFIAACGFTHHGPKGEIGFAPKIRPDAFSAAFTSAAAFGVLNQTRETTIQRNEIVVRHGSLPVRKLRFEIPEGATATKVSIDGAAIPFVADGARVVIALESERRLRVGDTLAVRIDFRR